MRPLLIDTNTYSAFKRGDSRIQSVFEHVEVLGMSPIVIGELLVGFTGGTQVKRNREELQSFLERPRIKIFNITTDTAHFFNQVHSALKRKGKPIPTNDIWLAAQALEQGCVMCTYDKYFLEVEGLIVGNSLESLVF